MMIWTRPARGGGGGSPQWVQAGHAYTLTQAKCEPHSCSTCRHRPEQEDDWSACFSTPLPPVPFVCTNRNVFCFNLWFSRSRAQFWWRSVQKSSPIGSASLSWGRRNLLPLPLAILHPKGAEGIGGGGGTGRFWARPILSVGGMCLRSRSGVQNKALAVSLGSILLDVVFFFF